MYDPLEQVEAIVVDAINIGILCSRNEPDESKIQNAILAFAEKYGLLGLMTALSTTTDFMNYDTVYLPICRKIGLFGMSICRQANIPRCFSLGKKIRQGINHLIVWGADAILFSM